MDKDNFSEWLQKFELVCKLKKVKDLQSVIALSLSCLMDNTKLNYAVLTHAFQNAFLCHEHSCTLLTVPMILHCCSYKGSTDTVSLEENM